MAVLVQKLDSGLWLRFLLSNPIIATEPGDIDAYIVSVRGDDGHERDVFCIVHFHPFLPFVRWVEIPEE